MKIILYLFIKKDWLKKFVTKKKKKKKFLYSIIRIIEIIYHLKGPTNWKRDYIFLLNNESPIK